MITFSVWMALIAAVIAVAYWFELPSAIHVIVAAIAAAIRLHLKFIASLWLLLTTRR